MPYTPQLERIAQLLEDMGTRVKTLSDRLNLAESVLRTVRRLTAVCAGLALLGMMALGYQAKLARDSATTSCEAQNRAREGSRVLWTNLLAGSAPRVAAPNSTDEERKRIEAGNKIRSDIEATVLKYFSPVEC